MQIYYALGMLALFGLIGFLCATFFPNLRPWQFKLVMLGCLIAAGATLTLLLNRKAKTSETMGVYENGLRFELEADSTCPHGDFLWDEVDLHSNRLMVQPASQLVNTSLTRATITYRLKQLHFSKPSLELGLFIERHQVELLHHIAAQMNCDVDQWAGNSIS